MKNAYRVEVLRSLFMATLFFTLCADGVYAQSYPAKPIRLILTFGGGGEAVARMLGSKLNESLGQSVLIDPQPAASGIMGTSAVARAAPDGYTLLFTSTSFHLVPVLMTKNTTFDPVKDFTPVTRMFHAISLVAASTGSSFRSIRDLIAAAKEKPKSIPYSTTGPASGNHFSAIMLQQAAGISLIDVLFKDAAQSMNEVVAGRIPILVGILATAGPQAAAGKLRILSVNSPKRYPKLPDVPTISEEVPGYEPAPEWNGIFGPARLPRPIVDRLNAEFTKSMFYPDLLARWDALGAVPIPGTPEEMASALARDYAYLTKIVAASGIPRE